MLFSLILGLAFAEPEEDETEEEEKTLADETKDFEIQEGLFNLFQDLETGDVRILIQEDQLNTEFIYFAQTRNGVLDARQFKGSYKDSSVFKIQKSYDRIEFVEQNTMYYFDPSNEISKAKDTNISPSVLASLEIIVTEDNADGTKSYLIDAESLFLEETFLQVKPSYGSNHGDNFRLGSLSSDKTKFSDLRNYPNNTDFIVSYVFEDSHPKSQGSKAVTDARNISVDIHHSFLAMPENDYQPRIDDYRIGYFNQNRTDLTSTEPAPYLDMINRWNLVKKDPAAAVSDPVEPIVWWIENTTPIEFRASVREGAESWNIAFEEAGFSNAVVVKQQPDDADWDAGDIDYNVLRWTASPRPPFGGYGPSFANPRTGQLLGADIMLEFVYVKNRVKYEELYQPIQTEKTSQISVDSQFCDFGNHLQENLMLGITTLEIQGSSEIEITKLLNQTIKHLVLHEVGHTLGLNHNMKASQTVSLENLHNLEWTEKHGLVGSVMDYTPINISAKGKPQGKYFADKPGSYDLWAIQFGYQPDLSEEDRTALLRHSLEPLLTFGNDADDMRYPGWGIDPRVNIGDLSNDTIGWAEQRIDIIDGLFDILKVQYTKENQSFQGLVNAHYSLLRQKSSLAPIASRYVGGVYVERAAADQFVDSAPYTPVPLKQQKRAMKFLAENYFASDAFTREIELAMYLQPQRRGYGFFSNTEDPKLHRAILSIQMNPINHLLHPQTLSRLTDSQLYGNEYSVTDLFDDLTVAIFQEEIFQNTNTQRQNLQTEVINRYIEVAKNTDGTYSSIDQSAATRSLKQVETWYSFYFGKNVETKSHRQRIILQCRSLWK